MYSGKGDCYLDRTALGDVVCYIYSREEDCCNGPVEPSRPGPSLILVTPSSGVCCHLQSVWLFSRRLVCYQSERKASFVSSVLDSIVWKQDAFHYPRNALTTYMFHPFALLRQVLQRVMLSVNLSLVLVASLWPQKEWFAYLMVLLMEEPLELPLLLIQPQTKKFHRGVRDTALSCIEVVE